MSPLVLITGASSGIGWALAQTYAAQGWRLVLVARDRAKLNQHLAAHAELGVSIHCFEADVADAKQMQSMAENCLHQVGLPDVVIANAGISHGVQIEDPKDWPVFEQIWRTNVMGVVHTLGPFVAPMRKRGSGRLVAISSVAGIRGVPGHAAYSSSKAACAVICESLRAELLGTGVRVSAILPGYVESPLTQNNPFSMPFLMSASAFAKRAQKAIARGQATAVIPWPMAVVAWLLKWMPSAWFDRFFSRQPRKPRLRS